VWAGTVLTDPAAFSGWHHHGEYDTYVYVISGRVSVESGPQGRDRVDAGADDFLYIPRGTVHREGNPDELPAHAVVVRVGSGQQVFNVEGPGT